VEQPAVAAVSANIRIDRNARERMEVWESLVVQMYERFGLMLLDEDLRPSDPKHFRRVVESSFAWRCFLERERQSGS
jgi:hypothetical protein